MSQADGLEAVSEAARTVRRRTLLSALASAGLLSVAGCLTGTDGGGGTETTTTTDTSTTEGGTTGTEEGPYTIEWTVEGATTEVQEDETLLDAALDDGLDVPCHCGLGVCGQCTSEVPGPGSEYVDHDGNQYLTDEQVQAGFVLTCVAYPKRDFEITTGKQTQADRV